jgi:hypothetical protein
VAALDTLLPRVVVALLDGRGAADVNEVVIVSLLGHGKGIVGAGLPWREGDFVHAMFMRRAPPEPLVIWPSGCGSKGGGEGAKGAAARQSRAACRCDRPRHVLVRSSWSP